jgi:hypothetical protein
MAKRKKGRTLGSSSKTHAKWHDWHVKAGEHSVQNASRAITEGACTRAFDHLREAREEYGSAKSNSVGTNYGRDASRLNDRISAQESRFLGKCVR